MTTRWLCMWGSGISADQAGFILLPHRVREWVEWKRETSERIIRTRTPRKDHHAHAGAGPSGFGTTASPSRATFVPPDPPPAFLDARSISPLVASHCEVVCAWIAAE